MSFDGTEPAPQAAAGWYPVDTINQRYWDGYEWTNHLAPLNPAPAVPAPTVPFMPPPPQGSSQAMAIAHPPSSDDRTYAVLMHVGGLLVSFLVPVIMWAIKKDESPFINHHGRQAMNFHFSMWIYMIVSFFMILFLVGFFMILALVVLYFVFGILAAVAANKGEYYRFPAVIPFFK